jgi:uncharacterized OB-fold protein
MLAEKPLPLPTEDTETYWESCHKGTLSVSTCSACGHRFLPPACLCPKCLSDKVAFAPVSGKAKVFSFIVVHRPQHPAFFDEAPYCVAIVELDEGPRMHTRLSGIDPKDVRLGMDVEVFFQKADDEISLPFFRPITR